MVKRLILSRTATDSKQSPSKYQWHFTRTRETNKFSPLKLSGEHKRPRIAKMIYLKRRTETEVSVYCVTPHIHYKAIKS